MWKAWDTAGDPTSNLYTFPEHVPAEAGGGGSPDNHKPSEAEQTEKKEERPARAEDKGEENPQQAPMVDAIPARPHRPLCAHPVWLK